MASLGEVIDALESAVKHTTYSYAPHHLLAKRLEEARKYLMDNREVMEHRTSCGDSCPCVDVGMEQQRERGVEDYEGRREV